MKTHYVLLLSAVLLFGSNFQAKSETKTSAVHDSAVDADGLPERWQYQPEYMQTAPADDPWWKQYNDPLLDSLIAMAEANNYNATAALKRIELAKRQVTAARASLYPQVGVSAGWNESRSAGAASNPATASHTGSYFNAGANVNWEIDVFGRVAAKAKAAKAGVQVSRAEYDGVIVSLCSELASDYFQLRTYQEQYRITLQHIEVQKANVRMTELRHEAGLGTGLEVSQAKTSLYTTQSSLPALEASIRTMANSIAILAGVYPESLAPRLLEQSQAMQPAPAVLSPGIPMDLLRRRPDIVEAEMQLAQYAAQIGVARKDFLPALALTGSIGTSAHDASNLFGKNSMEYSVGATLSWTVFDGFARSNNVAEAKLQLEAATDDYNLTVMTAVEEVENAITLYNAAVDQVKALQSAVDESENTYRLSVQLYKDGLSDFLNVTNAQAAYLENQLSLASATGSVYSAQITLYKALGGGIIQ
ncbi:MAG: efflux transporter outer membrane subunit [Muribaculaceae bacterium]|nr:efflux transporter outer membrane subunit [Muribaculaceae bacterium]